MVLLNYKKKSADFRQRSQAHHKPNIQWVSLHLYGTNPIVYSFARFYFEVVIRERLSKLFPNVLYPSFARTHCKYNYKFNVFYKMNDKIYIKFFVDVCKGLIVAALRLSHCPNCSCFAIATHAIANFIRNGTTYGSAIESM